MFYIIGPCTGSPPGLFSFPKDEQLMLYWVMILDRAANTYNKVLIKTSNPMEWNGIVKFSFLKYLLISFLLFANYDL